MKGVPLVSYIDIDTFDRQPRAPPDFYSLADETTNQHGAIWKARKVRLVKLLVIVALPMVATITQCGFFLERSKRDFDLYKRTADSVNASLDIGYLVSQLHDTMLAEDNRKLRQLTSAVQRGLEKLSRFQLENEESSENGTRRGRLMNDFHPVRETVADFCAHDTANSTESFIDNSWKTIVQSLFLGGDRGGHIWSMFISFQLLVRYRLSSEDKAKEDCNQTRTEIRRAVLFNTAFAQTPEIWRDVNDMLLHNNTGNVEIIVDKLLSTVTARINTEIRKNKYEAEFYYYTALILLICTGILCPLLCIAFVRSAMKISAAVSDFNREINRTTTELIATKANLEHLEQNSVPNVVLSTLGSTGKALYAEEFDSVSLLCLDVADIQNILNESNFDEVLTFLDTVFGILDRLTDRHSVCILKIVGDAALVSSGLPVRITTPVLEICQFALVFLQAVTADAHAKPDCERVPLRVRVGIHTGSCTAGILHGAVPSFGIFGRTANVALQMRNQSKPGKILLSNYVKLALNQFGGFRCKPYGPVSVPEFGTMYTWWLVGKTGIDFSVEG